jgi:hypothetical protein
MMERIPEGWNNGLIKHDDGRSFFPFPIFHYSIIPTFLFWPLPQVSEANAPQIMPQA